MHERERWQVILTEVRRKGVLKVRDLATLTNASAATLRRDLTKLEEMGQIRRMHGGIEAVEATRQQPLSASAFGTSQAINADRKRLVAQAAAALCRDGESIIINAGSTTWFMAEYLRARRMQILTNSMPIAQELLATSQNRIVLPGGEVYREPGIILSPFDEDAIQHYTASKMFMSCYGVTPLGILESDPLIARAEAKLLSRAEKLIVIADSSKFEPKGNMVVCPMARVSTIITDSDVEPAALAAIRATGVEVIVVPRAKEDARDAA